MGNVYLYTGTGGGKTASALGMALRSVGHHHTVVIVQFLKWWENTGEYKIKNMLKPYYEIYQFGREGWHGLANLDDRDRKLAKEGIVFAKKIVEKKKPNLLILDEINLVIYCKLLDLKEVIAFLDTVPEETDVVLTGRFASKELFDRADFVNEILDIKYPEESIAAEGIQY